MISSRTIRTSKIFPPTAGERYIDGLNVMAEGILPVFDVFGTLMCKGAASSDDYGLRYQQASAAAGVLVLDIPGSTDPARIWKVLCCEASNDDAANSRMMKLGIKIGAFTCPLESQWVSQLSDQGGRPSIVLHRPFYLPAGYSVHAEVDALAAGKIMSIKLLYIDLPIGEYTLVE